MVEIPILEAILITPLVTALMKFWQAFSRAIGGRSWSAIMPSMVSNTR